MGRCITATARFTQATSSRIFYENTTTRPVMLLALVRLGVTIMVVRDIYCVEWLPCETAVAVAEAR